MGCVVHILANDTVAKWLVVFLESFRAHNPELDVVIVPYSDAVSRVREIAAAYNCLVGEFDFARIDAFANEMFKDKTKIGRLRKLVAFDSTVDTSIYIDIDVIVTSRFPFSDLGTFDGNLIFGTRSRNNVYNSASESEALMGKSQFFSSGFMILNRPREWAGSEKIIKFIEENREEYLKIRAPYVIDQPILNYYMDKLSKKPVLVSDVWPGLSPHNWYNDQVLHRDPDGIIDKYNRRVFFIHWAGEEKNAKEPLRFSDLRDEIMSRIRERFGASSEAYLA